MTEMLAKAGVAVPSNADPVEQNLALQQAIADLQTGEQHAAITPLIVALHKRMTDRAIALIPPPKSRP